MPLTGIFEQIFGGGHCITTNDQHGTFSWHLMNDEARGTTWEKWAAQEAWDLRDH